MPTPSKPSSPPATPVSSATPARSATAVSPTDAEPRIAVKPLARQKRELRRMLRQRRRSLTRREQESAAQAVAQRMERDTGLTLLRSRAIAAYWAADGELDPRPLLARAERRRKAIYLPVLRPGNQLRFRRWKAGEPLKRNRYGIPEPQLGRLRPAWAMGILLLPLVGFDRRGGRLGMGGGFYDRTLASLVRASAARLGRRPLLLGLAHRCQEIAAVPRDAWDISLDGVITDREWIPVTEGCSDE